MQLLCDLQDGMLTTINAFALDVVRGTRREPAESTQYYLQVLTKIVARHRQQHGVKLSAASEIMPVPLTLTGTDRAGVMHMFGLRRRSGHVWMRIFQIVPAGVPSRAALGFVGHGSRCGE